MYDILFVNSNNISYICIIKNNFKTKKLWYYYLVQPHSFCGLQS